MVSINDVFDSIRGLFGTTAKIDLPTAKVIAEYKARVENPTLGKANESMISNDSNMDGSPRPLSKNGKQTPPAMAEGKASRPPNRLMKLQGPSHVQTL